MTERAATLPAATLPEVGYVRLPQVLAVYPISRSTWLAGVKTGRFPQPVRLGVKAVGWRVDDIRALLAKTAA